MSNFNVTKPQGLDKKYNAAAWSISNGTALLLRKVATAGKTGQPDKGPLVLIKLDFEHNLIEEKEVWQPQENAHFLEDPRVIVLEDGRILTGLTAVEKQGNDFIPYPAITYLKNKEDLEEISTVKRIIKELGPGKNVTPISQDMFLFRPEGDQNNHRLRVVKWDEDNENVEIVGNLDFPKDISWATFRIGTTISPIWITNNEALMVFHGIEIVNKKFIYSIGRAKVIKNKGKLYLECVDKEPILHPDDLVEEGRENEELHQERRVIYSCGGITTQNELCLYVNVGDAKTVAVTFSMEWLKRDWWI